MDKIIFEDLPSKNTPLSGETLNKLQNNIEEAIEKVIIELFGTSEKPINANEIIDIGIYKISGVIENFHNNIVYNQFIMYVNWDEYKLVQTIIGEGCIYYRSAEEFRGSFNWSDWQLQSSGGITGGDTLPIGTILPFGSDTVPDNYLLCKGQELPRAEFRELFNVIGTTYGEGDGSTTFALPNLCGRVPVGKDSDDTDFDTLGKTGGEKKHKLTTSEIPSHSHHISSVGIGSGSYGYNISSLSIGSEQKEYTDNTGGSQPHNNLQPYIVTNYIIKAKMGASLTGQVIDSLDSSSTTDAPSINAVNKGLKTNIVTGEEFKTGRVIDGKEEYGKKINFTFDENITDWVLLDTISNLDEITDAINGTITDTSGNLYTIPYSANNELVRFYFKKSTNELYVKHNVTYWNNKNARVYIYYTKN